LRALVDELVADRWRKSKPPTSLFNSKCSGRPGFSLSAVAWGTAAATALLGVHFGAIIPEEIRSWWIAERNELSLTSAKPNARPSVGGYAANSARLGISKCLHDLLQIEDYSAAAGRNERARPLLPKNYTDLISTDKTVSRRSILCRVGA